MENKNITPQDNKKAAALMQQKNIIIAAAGFILTAVVVGLIGYLVLSDDDDFIQGQVEVTEYRVSSKVPGRILELRVREGDYVKVGDTLAIIDAPEVKAKLEQARSAESAASAMDEMAKAGARNEQVRGAKAVLDQANAGLEVAKKSYERIQRLFEAGVVSEQKRDEVYANYKVLEGQAMAAKSQYDMAVNGARREEKLAAEAQLNRAKGAVKEVDAYIDETIQRARVEGEVADVYPKRGELVGTGSPIMSIAILDDVWGTFNVREDQLHGLKVGDEFTAFVPAFSKEIRMKVYFVKDEGDFAAWKATKSNGGYDLRTFEVKARPVEKTEGLRPGMSLIIKELP